MDNIYQILFFLAFIRTTYSNIGLLTSMIWLSSKKNKTLLTSFVRDKRFIVIIPVLREKKILRKTVEHFMSMNYDLDKISIILVSTEKEFINTRPEENTIELINNLSSEVNNRFNRDVIIHLHYPSINGKMVHQLNYAFDYILNSLKIDSEETFCAIYNADSSPNKDTFLYVADFSRDKKLRIFQQSALYFSNFEDIKNDNKFLEKYFLLSNALLHSRWTLAHEIPRLLRQSFAINKFNNKIFLSHCVGHGLFLRGDLLREVKEMPSTAVTEDLFFGYIMSVRGESINPLPILENAEVPSKFLSALKQKYVWFFGPLDHFYYEKYFTQHFPGQSKKSVLKWFTFQGIVPAIAWLLMGWIFLFLLIYPLILKNYWFLFASLLLFILYGPLSYSIVLFFSKKEVHLKNIKIKDYFYINVFCLVAIIIHSMPPIITIIEKIKSLVMHKEPNKPKTER